MIITINVSCTMMAKQSSYCVGGNTVSSEVQHVSLVQNKNHINKLIRVQNNISSSPINRLAWCAARRAV